MGEEGGGKLAEEAWSGIDDAVHQRRCVFVLRSLIGTKELKVWSMER